MGCLIVLLSMPRFILIALYFLSDFPQRAFEGSLWPVVGWFLLPYTTIAWMLAYGLDSQYGSLFVVCGIFVDFLNWLFFDRS